MDLTLDNLCDHLTRSRLLAPHEIEAARRRWEETAADKGPSSSQFTRWLIRENLLTEYQASLLSKGHVDDFFLNDYKILERVGRGRMAGVYKAVRADGQIVAVKVLPPSRARIPALFGRFQREARLSLQFDHPNVVKAFDVGETKGLHYLVMEFLEGETAEDMLLRRRQLNAAEAGFLIRQAMLGLQHLHDNDVVHRDLKPANLMLVPDLRGDRDNLFGVSVKILDIGLARPLFEDSNPGVERSELSELTQEGVLLGTPDYLSPEQARDPRSIDIRSDLYSLGCVLHHLMTGQPPFPDGNILNQMVRHATEMPRPVRDFNPSCPEAMQQIVYYLLAKQASQRYPTPARAAEALQAFLDAQGITASAPPPKSTPRLELKPEPRPEPKPESKPDLKRPAVGRPAGPPPKPVPRTGGSDIEVQAIEIPALAVEPTIRRPQRSSVDWTVVSLVLGALVLVAAIAGVLWLILRT
jgi:eukaryotic-like serine/threonine-protein kinase